MPVRIINKIINKIELLYHTNRINIFKTIYINLRLLKYKECIKLPIYVYGNTSIRSSSGSIVLNGKITRGMVSIGTKSHGPINYTSKTSFYCSGKIVVNGKIIFANGSLTNIQSNGELLIGDNVFIAENVHIICCNKITIGNGTRIGHETQIIDTNFHYIADFNNYEISNCIGEVVIGCYNWIGNRVSINKDTHTANSTIIASKSLLNKNYSEQEGCIVGGIPARIISNNVYRIFNKETEVALRRHFNEFNIPYKFDNNINIR